MALEITVGPPQLAINEGNVVLVTDPDGQIVFPSDKGIYFFDTRLINSWSISANGVPWDLLNSGNIKHYASRIFLTNCAISTEDGEIPRHSIGLSIGRSLGGGMHEDLDLTNHGPKTVRFNLEIAVRCDFADIFEVKSKRIVRRTHPINAIAPGAIRTPINRDAWATEEAYQRLLTLIPYGRIGEPEDIGRAAVWLASDASDYVVGTTLFVDGGMTRYLGFGTNG